MTTFNALYQSITHNILDDMRHAKDAVMPWQQQKGLPHNAATGRTYQGINILSLWAEAKKHGYNSPVWASYKQWNALGAQVKKGEKGASILYYQPLPNDDDDEKPRRFSIKKTSRVFNACQVEGCLQEPRNPLKPVDALETVENFVHCTGAIIHHEGDSAYYHPKNDEIVMPPRERFHGTPTSNPTESYYSVLLHELTHWTGASHRCNRVLSGRFGTKSYAMEELVAELGAAFLCAELGISNAPRQDHANYIAGWIELLEEQPKTLFTAAGMASEATTFLHDLQPDMEVTA